MIKRYDVYIPNISYITECEDGEFVSADDHDRLVAEYEDLIKAMEGYIKVLERDSPIKLPEPDIDYPD